VKLPTNSRACTTTLLRTLLSRARWRFLGS